MLTVRTTDGAMVSKSPKGLERPFTAEEAEADCAARNARAEKLDIKTRYEIAGVLPEAKAA